MHIHDLFLAEVILCVPVWFQKSHADILHSCLELKERVLILFPFFSYGFQMYTERFYLEFLVLALTLYFKLQPGVCHSD